MIYIENAEQVRRLLPPPAEFGTQVQQTPEFLAADDLDWSRTNPCADCPFLKTSPFHQGVAGSIPAVMHSLERGEFGHTCHKTDKRQT